MFEIGRSKRAAQASSPSTTSPSSRRGAPAARRRSTCTGGSTRYTFDFPLRRGPDGLGDVAGDGHRAWASSAASAC